MTHELKMLFLRAYEIKGENCTIEDVYQVLEVNLNYYSPKWLYEKYLNLKNELDEYVKTNQ